MFHTTNNCTICYGFENNNRCDVDFTNISLSQCPIGSDCADCKNRFPLWHIATIIFSSVYLFGICCTICLRYNNNYDTSEDV